MITKEAEQELIKESKKEEDAVDKKLPLKKKYKPNKDDDLAN